MSTVERVLALARKEIERTLTEDESMLLEEGINDYLSALGYLSLSANEQVVAQKAYAVLDGLKGENLFLFFAHYRRRLDVENMLECALQAVADVIHGGELVSEEQCSQLSQRFYSLLEPFWADKAYQQWAFEQDGRWTAAMLFATGKK